MLRSHAGGSRFTWSWGLGATAALACETAARAWPGTHGRPTMPPRALRTLQGVGSTGMESTWNRVRPAVLP